MRFLADESCDFIVVKALRAAGHDVLIVSEMAVRERRSFNPDVFAIALAHE